MYPAYHPNGPAPTNQAAARSTRNIRARKRTVRPSAGSPTCQTPPTQKNRAAAAVLPSLLGRNYRAQEVQHQPRGDAGGDAGGVVGWADLTDVEGDDPRPLGEEKERLLQMVVAGAGGVWE